MSNPWFRLYSRMMTDPKVEFLSFEDQRHFVWLLCMKNEGYLDEKYPSPAHRDRMIARKLGLQGEAFENAKQRLLEVELIDVEWQPVRWDDLQFQSDTSKERMRKYRERKKKNGGDDEVTSPVTSQVTEGDVTVTAQDTDTEEDKELRTPNGVLVQNGGEPPSCPHEKIIEIYHEVLPTLRRVRDWNETRQGYLRSRWRENPERQDPAWWRKFFEYVGRSDFLMGRVELGTDRKPFQADLEWIVKPLNFTKIYEGRYHG